MARVDTLTFTNPPTLYDPLPHAYSHVAQFPADWRVIMAAGQVGGSVGRSELASDFRSQFQQALENTRRALEAAGATLRDIAKFTIYIVDHDEEKFAAYRDEMTRIWGDQYPAGTLIPVHALALPGLLVEFDATAVVPND